MKTSDKRIKPSIQWVRPVPVDFMQRSFTMNEASDVYQKKMTVFEEIFPEKGKAKDVKTKEYKEANDTFHRAMASVLTVGQCFGILPVMGIRDSDPSHLQFTWFSWRVGFTLISMACCFFMNFMSLLRMITGGVNLFKTIGFIFYMSTLTVLILFLRLAPKWPALVMAMSRQERSIKLTRRPLRTRFSLCCFAILFPALLEHVLAIVASFAVAYDCNFGRPLVESYFVNCYPQVFEFIEYALWKGIILQLINLESTFNWNFMDLFIIVISLGLTDRFNQLNKRLEAAKGKSLPEQFWKSAREEYAHLSRLVKEVDTAVNEIVLLSFANNLYFICVQLFNSLNNTDTDSVSDSCGPSKMGPLRGLSNIFYFGFSFGLLMIRSVAVSLGAARIHSSARQPAASLYAAPSSSYGTEAQRFLEQVVTDDVALTGLNFFNVTRGLVLTIAGTIVTYELVLVQFNTSPPPVTANITINESCGIPIKV